MARFSGGARSTGAGSTTLPVGALCGTANGGGRLREVGIFNTTTTAVIVALKRLTSAGTPGSGLVEDPWDANLAGPQCVLFDTYTSTGPTLGNDLGFRKTIAGIVGDGVIWTFGAEGIVIPKGTANGIAIIPASGTGQILDWYAVWDE